MKKYIASCLITLTYVLGFSQTKLSIQAADSLYSIGKYREAIANYEAALKSTPANAVGWNRLGYSYHNVKDYNNAIRSYNTALKHGPSVQLTSVVLSRLARVYALKDDKEKAFEYLDKATIAGFTNLNELNENTDYSSLRNDTRFAKTIETTSANAFPCTMDPKNREFDFWVGEWDVYLTSNLAQRVGFNKIIVQPGGCSLLESWEGAGLPNVGQSINYYDAASGKWEQLWVGSGGGSNSQGINIGRFYGGVFSGNSLVFKWDPQKGSIGRFTFTKISSEKVTQHKETSTDNGSTWQTIYNFTYIKRK